ncbi:MAG: hypothetical protein DMG76_37420 [Acidobacteria bacterium]|nr:MAG: hypothetical protein DMG76_37420 [Acidobacteriota bacterium]
MTENIGNLTQDVRMAVAFVDGVELPPAPRLTRVASAVETRNVFDETKNQAMVVGSDIVSFVAGLAPRVREVIVNSSLLAQLAANRRVPSREDIRAWYEVYFDTLAHLGWATQERAFSEHRETGDDFEAEQAILSVATVVLGPATTALAVVASTLNAMKSMSDGPWMTVFKRESQTAKAARFQVTVAEPKSESGSMISLMAFELDAKNTLTQVLFFKFHSTEVTLRHSSGRATVDSILLQAIRPMIAEKVSAYTRSYVEALRI